MNEWWLIAFFSLLVLLILPVALYPLRSHKLLMGCLLPLLIISVSCAYWRWGAWPQWRDYKEREAKQQQVQAILKSIKSPQELIEKLKARLDDKPASARGWYLLGRLYGSQNEWIAARDAFAKAHLLQAEDEAITLNYAQSLWQINKQQFNPQIKILFQDVLKKNNQQPDALAMLAMNAFLVHDYQLAIDYWQRLLKLAPEQSEEAQSIRKAIAKAQSRL